MTSSQFSPVVLLLSCAFFPLPAAPKAAGAVQVANDRFSVAVDREGTFHLLDKAHRVEYGPDPWGGGAGTVTVIRDGRTLTLRLSEAGEVRRQANGTAVEVSFIWNQGIRVRTRIALAGEKVTVSVEEVTLPAGHRLESLVYPSRFAPLKTGERGYLIVPYFSGAIIPTHDYTRIGGQFWRMDDAYRQNNASGMEMNYFQTLLLNFFGLQKGDAGLTFVCESPFDARLQVFANTRGNRYPPARDPIAAFSSVWLASLGSLRYPRQLAIWPHGNRGYVESCAIYRRWLDEKGWTRTLREKIKQNPEREKLIGSTHVDVYGGYPHYAPDAPAAVGFTFKRIKGIVESLRNELKLDRVSLTAWGTFENYPPNCWPINLKRGGAGEWKSAVDAAKQAGYLITGYHAYAPMLEQDPSFDARLIYQSDPNSPEPAKRLRVMRWLRTCGSLSLDYARRNLPRELEAAGQTADFTDIIGTHPGSECYDVTHHKHAAPLTREQDMQGHNALLGYIHDELNLPCWIERGSAAMLKTVDSFHGAAEMERQFEAIGIAVPLLKLVANDCVIVRQHPEQTHRDPEGQLHTRLLMNIVQGNPPIHCLQAWEFDARKPDIAALHQVLAKIHRQVALAKMTDHRFLPGRGGVYGTDTFHVQKSVFSDGTLIYVNFGLQPYRDADVTLEGYGFEVRLGNGEVLKGAAESWLRLR